MRLRHCEVCHEPLGEGEECTLHEDAQWTDEAERGSDPNALVVTETLSGWTTTVPVLQIPLSVYGLLVLVLICATPITLYLWGMLGPNLWDLLFGYTDAWAGALLIFTIFFSLVTAASAAPLIREAQRARFTVEGADVQIELLQFGWRLWRRRIPLSALSADALNGGNTPRLQIGRWLRPKVSLSKVDRARLREYLVDSIERTDGEAPAPAPEALQQLRGQHERQ